MVNRQNIAWLILNLLLSQSVIAQDQPGSMLASTTQAATSDAEPFDLSEAGTIVENSSDPEQNVAPSKQSDVSPNPDTRVASAIGSEFLNTPKNVQKRPLTELIINDDNLRLLEIHVGKYKLDDLLAAYQYQDMTFIPLGFFSELIDMAVTADPATGIAQGFVFRENRTFYLDVNRGEVTQSGKLELFDKSRAALVPLDDIYIESALINEWFPMTIDIDLYSSRIKLDPDVPLPFQMRKRREERIQHARTRRTAGDRGYPRHREDYLDWDYPVINQTARVGVLRSEDGEYEGQFGYSTYATADLLNMESAWYLSGTDEDVFDEFRVTFSRHDPSGALLGPMKATEYALGHISEPRLDLVTRTTLPQPGATVSNYPLSRQSEYDSHTFRGDLPPGWEVELYRNNSLLDYQASGDEGLYHFDNVPLLYGQNYFRLVFYGPQGQQREETRTFTLDRALTQAGKHYYRLLTSNDENDGTRALAQYDVGISKRLSLAANFASIPLNENDVFLQEERNHNYFSTGIRGFWNSLFYRSDYIADMQSGNAFNWNVQLRLWESILNFGETYFTNDFISEEFPETFLPIERRTDIKLDTAIPASDWPRIPVAFEYQRDDLEGNITVTRFANRISMSQRGLALSNTINVNKQTGLQTVTVGNLQISRRAFGYNLRGTIGYEMQPDSGVNSFIITTDGIRWHDYHVSGGYSRIIDNDIDQVFFNLTRSKGAYSLGVNTRYSTGGVFALDLSFTMGIGREPRSNTWRPEYRPIANQGSVSVQAYMDNNLNSKKDPGENSLPDLRVKINGGKSPQLADENGIVYITGLETYNDIDLEIALDSLEDPLWQPAIKGKRVNLRPGHVAQIDFPIIVTGEIDGTAFIQLGDERREVSGVVIEVLDEKDNIIKTTKTEYDGFYLISGIPVGAYQLRVSDEQINKLGLEPVQPVNVKIDIQNPIANGMDFILMKK